MHKSKVLRCKEDDTKLRKFLYKYLPFLPASLPVLLFCRLAELTVLLERGTMLTRPDWEAAVHERILLSWMANDVKLIGMCIILVSIEADHIMAA